MSICGMCVCEKKVFMFMEMREPIMQCNSVAHWCILGCVVLAQSLCTGLDWSFHGFC